VVAGTLIYSFGVTEFSISGFVMLTISSIAYYVKHSWSSTMNGLASVADARITTADTSKTGSHHT